MTKLSHIVRFVDGGYISEAIDTLIAKLLNNSSLRRRCSYEPGSQKVQDLRSDIGKTISNKSLQSNPTQNYHFAFALASSSVAVPPSGVDSAITDQLSKFVGDLQRIRRVLTKYFSTIHLWMPVISEPRLLDRLPRIFLEPQADVSLLTLSIALITTLPVGSDVLSSASPMYTLVKSSIAVVEAANINSLEVLQSRLLLSLFEVGHGIDPAAYITLGATARAAAAMGVNLKSRGRHSGRQVPLERSDEAICVWWAIVILDRYASSFSPAELNCFASKSTICDCTSSII